MTGWSQDEWADAAREGVRRVLAEQYAVTTAELEARLGEAYHARHVGNTPHESNIDPHHVTTATRELLASGEIRADTQPTRGGRAVTVFVPGNQYKISTKVTRAARRKRMLQTGYISWSEGSTKEPHGTIGPAGERAVRTGLLGANGVQALSPNFDEVRSVLGVSLNGPLDTGGYATVLHEDRLVPVVVMIEVKNLRGWIYPSSPEVYQVLTKALDVLQKTTVHSPLVVPVLICRKAHRTTYFMAKQLGFLVVELGLQYVGTPQVGSIDAVRNELGYADIREGDGPSLRVRDRFSTGQRVHQMLPGMAETWAETAAHLATEIRRCKQSSNSSQRSARVEALRQANRLLGRQGGW